MIVKVEDETEMMQIFTSVLFCLETELFCFPNMYIPRTSGNARKADGLFENPAACDVSDASKAT